LRITDTASGDTGTLTAWSLTFTYPAAACGPHGKYNAHAAVADTCSGTGSGGGNGVWEAGETVQFSVSVENDGTDTLTGVVVTVTPVTPGVTMVDGTASYANIAVGATGTSQAPHFTAQLPTGLACGSTVQFSVSIATGQGSWSGDTFTHVIGVVSSGNGTALDVNFSSGIPATWTIVDGGAGGGTAATWTTANPGSRTATAPISTPFAIVDSDYAGSSATQDEQLITPVLDLSSATTVTLEFDQYFNWISGYGTDIGDVDVRSSLTSNAWVNVFRNSEADSPNPDHKTLNITVQSAGADNVQIRFRYTGAYDMYWMVDNVKVTYTAPSGCTMDACTPAAGGPPPVNHAGTGAAKFAKGAGQTLNVAYDAATCSAEKVVILYGALNDFTGYAGCAQSNGEADGTTTIDSTDHASTWYNLVWVEGTTAGHPGFGTGGARTWNAAGLCGVTADDKSHATCP